MAWDTSSAISPPPCETSTASATLPHVSSLLEAGGRPPTPLRGLLQRGASYPGTSKPNSLAQRRLAGAGLSCRNPPAECGEGAWASLGLLQWPFGGAVSICELGLDAGSIPTLLTAVCGILLYAQRHVGYSEIRRLPGSSRPAGDAGAGEETQNV